MVFSWFKVDTAAIMFSSLSDKSWGRTFRFSAYFKDKVDPACLERAVTELMPYYPSVYSYLKTGFFWNYLVKSSLLPEIREENSSGMLPVVKRRDGRPDFRITYKDNRINIECSHSLGDGKGMNTYFTALLNRYNELRKGEKGEYIPQDVTEKNIADSFSDYYIKGGEKASDSSEKAFHFPEVYEKNYTRLLFAEMSTAKVRELAKNENMTVTEYLTAVLILGVIKANSSPVNEPVTVAVPVNLRRFFPSETLRNFTVQTFVTFRPEGRQNITLKEILEETRGQLKAQTEKKELQKVINKYGALVNNPVIKIVPNVIKQPVMKMMQKKTHAGATAIFTNFGAYSPDPSLACELEKLQFVNGDTRKYGLAVTCSCASFGDRLSLCFSAANRDTLWFDACVKELTALGIEVRTDIIEGDGEAVTYKEKNSEKFSFEKIKAFFNT